MKKWIALFLAPIMALSLAACSGDSGTGTGGEKEEEKDVKAYLLKEIVTEDGDGDITSKVALSYDEDYHPTGAQGYEDDELRMEITFDKDIRKPLMQQNYDEDGDKTSHRTYTYDADGNQLTNCYYDEDGEIISGSEYTYDGDGNVLSFKSFTDDEVVYECRFTYNQDGLVLTEATVWEDGSQDYWEYTYDEHGNVLTKSSDDPEDEWNCMTYENTYADGELTEVKGYQAGELTEVTRYDQDGNIIYECGYYAGVEYTRSEYTYSDGKLMEEIRYSEGEETYKQSNTYDEDGNLVGRVICYEGEEYEKLTYAYNDGGYLTAVSIYIGGELDSEYTLTYQEVTVPKKVAKRIGETNDNFSLLGW